METKLSAKEEAWGKLEIGNVERFKSVNDLNDVELARWFFSVGWDARTGIDKQKLIEWLALGDHTISAHMLEQKINSGDFDL